MRSPSLQSPLRQRRVAIVIWRLLVGGFCLFAIWSANGGSTSDWRRYDHQIVRVDEVTSGDTFRASSRDGGNVAVRLLGICAPLLAEAATGEEAHGAAASKAYLIARIGSSDVRLRLDAVQTRTTQDELLAYAYITNADCINADVIRDGHAFADRRTAHAYHTQYEQAENEARLKGRGLWKGLSEEQMPAWRRAWLHRLVKDRLGKS